MTLPQMRSKRKKIATRPKIRGGREMIASQMRGGGREK
jgi:hypothetical protein